MGRSGDAGEGGSLDFSHHTYEELRAAVYGVSGEGVVVASNQVADLKRMLNERVGTLSVVVARLAPAWVGPGGDVALRALRRQLSWFTEFARVVSWNGERLAEVTDAYYKAQRAMRELDAAPERPNPRPVPSPGGSADPADLNWRQPPAARIANYLFSEMAVAAATFARPPESHEVKPNSSEDEGIPGDGPVVAAYGPGGGSGSGNSPGGAGGGRGAQGGASDLAGPVVQPGVGGRSSGLPAALGVRAGERGGAGAGTGGAGDSGAGGAGSGAVPGVGSGRTARGTGQVGRSGGSLGRPGARPTAPGGTGGPTVHQPVGRTLGGGVRPPSGGTPVPPGSGSGQVPPAGRGVVPPGAMPGAGSPVQGDRSGQRRRRLERGDPHLFRNDRRANKAGGELRRPADERSVVRTPSTIGTQRLPQEREPWAVPDPPKVPPGFPEKLESFTRADGARFEVRRVQSG